MTDYRRTGAIWEKAPRSRSQIVRRVCEALGREYGLPRLGNPERPLDDLIYIMLSNRTAPPVAERTYDSLRDAFPTWEDLLVAPASSLEDLLRPAGLALKRSQQIRGALREIAAEYGSCDLEPLTERPTEEIEAYLTSLPGVSEKVAKCVMMYTMDKNVLPVDSHVHRIATRLGWTARKRLDQCHDELEALVPPHRRYAFHVDCILHGRTVCRPSDPVCRECCIRQHCHYFEAGESSG